MRAFLCAMNPIKFLRNFFVFCVFAPSYIYAAPPLKADFKPEGPVCFLNRTLVQQHAHRLRTKGDRRPFAPPSLTNPRVLVIRVQFTDLPSSRSLADSNVFFDRVSGFFSENSYGLFVPTFTVSAETHTAGSLATYGADCGGDVACRNEDLRGAAIAAEVNAGRDFSAFDQIQILHSGFGQETTGQPNDIWSVFFPGSFAAGGINFNGTVFIPEREAAGVDPLGVVCHEYGHQIGLPDLYDVSSTGGRSTVGSWDVMDFPYSASPGNGPGSNPSHLGAWSKQFLGFVTPVIGSSSTAFSLSPSATSAVARRIPVQTGASGPDAEYFLVEYRLRATAATFDKGLLGDGLAIWHVDETVAFDPDILESNVVNTPSLNGAGRRGVDLVEADGTEIYSSAIPGQAGDVFIDGRNFVSPKSDAFGGNQSGISIGNILGVGESTAQGSLFIASISSISVVSGVSVTTETTSSFGAFSFTIPPGAFNDGSTLFFAPLDDSFLTPLGAASAAGSFSRTGAGFLIGASGYQQPGHTLMATVDFSLSAFLSALSDAEKSRLTLARYAPPSSLWVPLPTSVDANTNRLWAPIDHFSTFQVMLTSLASSAASVKIFPNPLMPGRGASYAAMNFTNVPDGTRVRVYSLMGELVAETTANASGLARWDGRNQSGHVVGSGVYFAAIEDPAGNREVHKIAVER